MDFNFVKQVAQQLFLNFPRWISTVDWCTIFPNEADPHETSRCQPNNKNKTKDLNLMVTRNPIKNVSCNFLLYSFTSQKLWFMDQIFYFLVTIIPFKSFLPLPSEEKRKKWKSWWSKLVQVISEKLFFNFHSKLSGETYLKKKGNRKKTWRRWERKGWDLTGNSEDLKIFFEILIYLTMTRLSLKIDKL